MRMRHRERGREGDGVAKVSIGLDAELVVEVMVLAGVGSPQDAVEAVVRDYIARGHRTETRTGSKDRGLREIDAKPQEPQG
ncbi:Type II toxin-antitoxin system VapB family antitoxin OS=Streptomyces tendae OX=1932 GN=GUR47_34550 PE=4 SV=1 [Streptomyces tendae]